MSTETTFIWSWDRPSEREIAFVLELPEKMKDLLRTVPGPGWALLPVMTAFRFEAVLAERARPESAWIPADALAILFTAGNLEDHRPEMTWNGSMWVASFRDRFNGTVLGSEIYAGNARLAALMLFVKHCGKKP
jgi:hypothetical protein